MNKYKSQKYPGTSAVAKNRKKYMDPSYKLEKLREVSEEDMTRILGHREPGERYRSVHPPLEKMQEPDCPIRELVEPIEGAKAGDRIRYVQFTDSVYFAPVASYVRAWMYVNRYRGIDTGVLSGRTIVEARERDVERIAKELVETEVFDPAKTGIRGATVHGHALRLDENGLMFDALQRYKYNKATGEVEYIKNQIGMPLDRPISLGKPLPEEELKKRTTIFRADGIPMEDDDEVKKLTLRIHRLRTLCGFQSYKVVGE